MSRLRYSRRLAGFLSMLILACRQPPPVPAQPAPVSDSYCWWTLLRTAFPPDSVAQRFAGAYQTLGLGNVSLTHRADTTWARGGPTILEGDPSGTSYASTAIAFRQGDSTSLRYFVEIISDSSDTSATPDRIEFCGRIAKEARVPWSRPQRRPNSADSLPVFMRQP